MVTIIVENPKEKGKRREKETKKGEEDALQMSLPPGVNEFFTHGSWEKNF